jgi:hypothetical protein
VNPNDWTIGPTNLASSAEAQLNDCVPFLTSNLFVHRELVCAPEESCQPPRNLGHNNQE